MADRDDFSPATRRTIAERAGYICSHPTCGWMTVGPSEDRVSGITMTGIAAHIVAAAPGGQRSDATLTSEERSAASNGIWMCAIHGKWIDDNPSLATVEKLLAWKSAHEEEISAWVEHGHPGIFKSWDRLAALSRDQRDTIETSLPNGHVIARECSKLLAALEETGACLVSGDSGVGKSALVKLTLDDHFPDARQVWLGPEALRNALSEAERDTLGLTAPLADLLSASAAPGGLLVLDAVERADALTITRLVHLVRDLAERRRTNGDGWRMIAIAQQAGFEVHLDPLVNALGHDVVSVAALGSEKVQEALQSVPALAQHANDEPFVALLGNLRTLGWIIAAGSLFAGADAGRMAARSQIADRLWAHWTGGDPDLQSFMIALARRDAEYERSFGLSDLRPEDRAAWKAGRQRLPLKLSDRNRLSFEHDLASDWARYQYLKEIGGEVTRWAALANEPLWVAGLRLFGQFLLREQDQATDGWDWAFAAAQAVNAADAVDVLLDALCLDPMADGFMTARTDVLFADNGKLLDRLLARFMHIATMPDRFGSDSSDPGVGLYAEAEMRSPVWAVWPPLIRFMVEHRSVIATFGSKTVAKICELWLTKTPTRINDREVLGRTGLAELALETARVDQIRGIAYNFYGGGSDEEGALFVAALAGAEDRPEAVAAFALEMARRRPLGEASRAKVDALRQEERRRRNEVTEGVVRRRTAPFPERSFLAPRKLPQWPLGPAGRLDDGFRTAVLRGGALNPLMRVMPTTAAEVLLACIIEDNPHEDMGGMRLDHRLGLDSHHEDRPIIFWNSPFLPFLMQAEEPALEALLKLLNFCTERWTSEEREQAPPPIRLRFADGTERDFLGDWRVLDWAHRRDSTNSQLFSALDALERRLWLRISAGEDIEMLCASLLARSGSAAILGILADCAKQEPQLLRGTLAPLLTSPVLLLREQYRLTQRFGSDGFAWHRAGEKLRALGAEWEQAPHRRASLNQAILDLRRADPAFEAQVREAIAAWPEPSAELALRQRALAAELDPANWQEGPDAEGKNVWNLHLPSEIAAEIEAMRPAAAELPSLVVVLRHLESMLGAPVNEADASELYAGLDDAEELGHFTAVERGIIETAIAALLFVRAGEWSVRDLVITERLSVALEQSVPSMEESVSAIDDRLDFGPGLAWAAIGAIHARAKGYGDKDRWDRILSYGLATGETGVVGTITGAARGLRDQLGPLYHAIVEAGVFAAILNALSPRMMGDPGSVGTVAGWRRRLARRPLAASTSPAIIDLVGLAERVERLWRGRFRRLMKEPTNAQGRRALHKRYSSGVGTQLLAAIFGWALNQDVAPDVQERPEHRQVIRMLWDFAEWRLRDDPYEPLDDNDGFDRLDDFGISIIRTIAARIPLGTAVESRILWEPVLALGPRGEFTLEHLIDCLFLRLYKDVDPVNFTANWDAMLAFVFARGWTEKGKWWKGRSILRHMLGIDAASQIANVPQVMAHVKNLAPYFEAFAAENIAHDDSALAAFANFFASSAGSSLRFEAIRWLEAALNKDDSKLKSNAGSTLAELARAMLAEHSAELVADRASRQALINVIGRLVRDQAPYALALQDRARALR